MIRPLRVAILARSVFPLHGVGGLERHVHDLVRHLALNGVGVTLITRDPGSGIRDPASEAQGPGSGVRDAGSALAGVAVRYVPYRTFPFAGRRGTTILDRSTAYPLFGFRAGRVAAALAHAGDVDVVHGLGASALGYAMVRESAGVPLVMNPQGLEEFGGTDPSRARLKRLGYLPLRAAVRRTARSADRVIATDRALEPVVQSHLGIPRERVRLIPNAIDLSTIDDRAGRTQVESVRAASGIRPGELVILSVGRLEENKGFHVLAEALSALNTHGALARRWRWVLVGEGPYRRQIERALGARGLSGRAVLAGRVSELDLHAWYEAAVLFVHPTLYEGSSLVTLEAMAHRRAIVATTAGGLPDKVRPGLNGWLVPPGNPAALAAALSGALAEPSRLVSLGEASRTIVEREFAWPAVTARLLELYDELVRV